MGLTHWKKLDNPDYIGAYAFEPNEEKVVTIRAVMRKQVTGAEGKKEECTVVYFVEPEKPLILNATNAKEITRRADSPYIENWAGVKIVLGVERVKAFGDVVDAVRVLKKAPPAPAEPVAKVCSYCGKQIADAGGWTAAQIARASVKKFGVPLCMECGEKSKGGQ